MEQGKASPCILAGNPELLERSTGIAAVDVWNDGKLESGDGRQRDVKILLFTGGAGRAEVELLPCDFAP